MYVSTNIKSMNEKAVFKHINYLKCQIDNLTDLVNGIIDSGGGTDDIEVTILEFYSDLNQLLLYLWIVKYIS